MPYAQSNEVEIFYETIGDGYPIVLQHGLADSHEEWYGKAREANYVKALQDNYQVVLLDARGHGKSSKPHTPEKYAMKYMVGDVEAVLNELNIEKAVFWGYSMGGRIGLAAAKYTPERFTAYVIGGNGLSEKDSKAEMEELQGYIPIFKQGVDAFLSWAGIEDLKDWEREKWNNTDFDALIAYCSNYENIGMADYLPKVTAPFLFYAGSEDKYPHSTAKACAEIMQNALFVSLPGLNHLGAFYNGDQVLPHVLKFLIEQT